MLPLLLTLSACLPGPVEYNLPDDTVLVTLIRAELKVDQELIGKWNEAQVKDGLHLELQSKLREKGKQRLFMDVPEDTPGYILPVLFGTAHQAGYTEVKLAQTGAPAVVGPLSFESTVAPDATCVKTSWLSAMRDDEAYGHPFKVAFIQQKDKVAPLPKIKVEACE